jgi:hypothetical protein
LDKYFQQKFSSQQAESSSYSSDETSEKKPVVKKRIEKSETKAKKPPAEKKSAVKAPKEQIAPQFCYEGKYNPKMHLPSATKNENYFVAVGGVDLIKDYKDYIFKSP